MMLFSLTPTALGSLLAFSSVTRTITVAASRIDASKNVIREAVFKKDNVPVVQGSYIVEFESVTNGNPHSFYSNLSSIKIGAEPRLALSNTLFNGASFALAPDQDHNDNLERIKTMEIVKNIWPIRNYELPERVQPLPQFTVAERSRKRSTGTEYPPHLMGRVDELHAEGLTGNGITIAVVDTGIDYNHPLLGGGFGPGFKVKGGYDFVGAHYTGSEVPEPDNDPMDCFGHGTHVAGIASAMRDPILDFSGVAPDATLLAYKVFGCSGNSPTDIVVQGLLAAYEASPDVIQTSIGFAGGWPEDFAAQIIERIITAGTPVVIAAANSGSSGPFYANGLCSASSICVGAIDNIANPELYADINSKFYINSDVFSFNYTAGRNDYSSGVSNGYQFFDFGTSTSLLYPLSLDTSVVADACTSLPDSTPDLAPFIILVREGGCSYDTKAVNIAAHGATKMIVYRDFADRKYIEEIVIKVDTNVMAAVVSAKQGEAFVEAYKTGASVVLDFAPLSEGRLKLYNVENTLSAGTVASYSSWGPDYEMNIKPDISAPGTLIFSTYLTTGPEKSYNIPETASGYGIHSGTSMAAPYISGVVALMKQAHSGLSPSTIRNILATTGKAVLYNNLIFHDDTAITYDYLSPVPQQGGGLIDAYAAVHYNTQLSVANIALNDTSHFQSKAPFSIQNTGSSPVTYKISHRGAATIFTFDDDAQEVNDFPFQMNKTFATARIEPSSITIAPGQSGSVVVHVTRPQALDELRGPLYSGFIVINGTNGENLNVPYMGIASRMKDFPVIYQQATYLTNTNLREGPTYPNDTFTFVKNSYNQNRIPYVKWKLHMGTANLRIDVVPVKKNGVGRVIGQKALGGIRPFVPASQGAPIYPYTYAPRSVDFGVMWAGQLENGDYAPEGEYTLLVRALRINGDPTYDHDYDRKESVPFWIFYKT